jgi:hypothetical protein
MTLLPSRFFRRHVAARQHVRRAHGKVCGRSCAGGPRLDAAVGLQRRTPAQTPMRPDVVVGYWIRDAARRVPITAVAFDCP